jgi:hypothetical protein
MAKINLSEDEHRLIIRYREQRHAFNEGVAAALTALDEYVKAHPDADFAGFEDIEKAIASRKKG